MRTEEGPTRRLSLTKSQRLSVAGAELLALCQSVTEDGSLSEEEIEALRAWLIENRSAELPAITFLRDTVEGILADGKVTKEERKSLYVALETVLPIDFRTEAKAKRRAIEEEERSKERQERAAQKEKEREEQQHNRPLASWNFMVAGVWYEGRPELIKRFVAEEDEAFLVRDRSNRFSRNAVEVRTKHGVQVGFVPEDYAVEMAPLLDQGCRHGAFFKKVLTESRVPIPVVQAYAFCSDATVEGAVLESEVPTKVVPPMSPAPTVTQNEPQTESRNKQFPESKAGPGCTSVLLLGSLAVLVEVVLWSVTR